MKNVKFDVTFSEKASRWELIIRFFWMIPSVIVVIVLAIIGVITWFLQLVHILVMGKRNKVLHSWILKYVSYHVKFQSYYCALTDERNPIMPED
jgi:hypothetical protein